VVRSLRIGVGIGRDAVRAIGIRGDRIVWVAQAALPADGNLATILGAMLERAPRKWWPRTPVVAAIGPIASQVRLIRGLPPFQETAIAAAMVRNSTDRFFLRNGIPLQTGKAALRADGVWVAAYDDPVVHAVTAGVRLSRCRLEGIVPAMWVLGYAADEPSIRWHDGNVDALGSYERRNLTALRRQRSRGQVASGIPGLADELERIGPEGPCYADAYGAAVADIANSPAVLASHSHSPTRFQLVVAAVAMLAALLALILAPFIVRYSSERRAAVLLDRHGGAAREAAAYLRDLSQFDDALASVAAFSSSGIDAVRLLAEVSDALPAGTALVGLRLEARGGHLVVVGRQVLSALERLEQLTDVESAEILGPVTRELRGGSSIERATIRLRLTLP
jgi:hypothetical protein